MTFEETFGGVRRTADGRPYIVSPCPDARTGVGVTVGTAAQCVAGRVPGARDGRTKACPACKGKGFVEKAYVRVTSFVGVLDDRSNLERWRQRTTLVGLAVDHDLTTALLSADPDDKVELDAIAEEAFEIGEGHAAARKGTDLHRLTEYVDRGQPLPGALTDRDTGEVRPVTTQDRADMAAWCWAVKDLGLEFVGSERFVVCDRYRTAGTYDRRVRITRPWGREFWPGDRSFCDQCERPVILDLKTGRIDYGAGRIAMQLAVYANSDDYDPVTGDRSPQDVCPHRGLVVHLPQGTGEATVWVADLERGWQAVALAAEVREHRRTSGDMLRPLGGAA